jgi:outer membrane autotransporter protein
MLAANARALPYLASMVLVFTATVGLAHAACTNASNFDSILFPTQTSSADGFAVGDQLTITATWNAGPDTTTAYAELSVGGSPVAPITGNFPVVVVYTVSAPFGPSTLFEIENTNNVNAIAISVTCVAAPAPTPGTTTTQSHDRAVTKAFLLSRINGMLLNSPASTSILYRQHEAQGAQSAAAAVPASDGPMNLGGTPVIRGWRFDDDLAPVGMQPLQFRASLSSMREAARQAQMETDRMALGAGDGGALPLSFESNPLWDVWAEGRYSGFKDDTANLGRDGHVGFLFAGTDYRIARGVIVGGLVQWDSSKDEADAIATKVNGTGWMIGPYVSARVHENIYADLRAAWGRSWNDLGTADANASFDTTRWLVKGAISGNWQWDVWRVTPSAELAYVTESQEAFTNSASVFVPGQDVSLGRLQFGPELGWRFTYDVETSIEPFAAIKGVWDWDNPNVQIIDGFIVGPGDFWGRLEGGLNVSSLDGSLIRILASWDGIGSSNYSGVTLQAIAKIPLD